MRFKFSSLPALAVALADNEAALYRKLIVVCPLLFKKIA